MSFADMVRERLPEALTLPEPFAETMDWLEAQGWAQDARMRQILHIYPPELADAPGASYVFFAFEAGPPLHEPAPEAMARIASIATIAGDGGTLALWRDPHDIQHIVVFDHGYPYVLTQDPLVALQFLAMGYPEPGALTDAGRSPAEDAALEGGDPPLLPEAFRGFLQARFGVTPPERLSDLGVRIPEGTEPDPIRTWMQQIMPEPGLSADNPYIVPRDMQDLLGPEGIEDLKKTIPYIVLEE